MNKTLFDLKDELDSSTGVQIVGAYNSSFLGYSTSSCGDTNGDGVDDGSVVVQFESEVVSR